MVFRQLCWKCGVIRGGDTILTDEATDRRDEFTVEQEAFLRAFAEYKEKRSAKSDEVRAVKKKQQRGAVALLREEYAFDLELSEYGDHTVFARLPTGMFSVQDVIDSLLSSPDGEAMRPLNYRPMAGRTFSAMLGVLKKK